MRLEPRSRWLVLGAGLVLALAATQWVDGRAEETGSEVEARPREIPATPSTQAKAPAVGVPEVDLAGLHRRAALPVRKDAFESTSWDTMALEEQRRREPPPPPPPPPPLQFKYMGRMIDDGRDFVFLTKQELNYVVKQGDTLDSVYRVEEITPTQLVLTYLPLKARQQLAIGPGR